MNPSKLLTLLQATPYRIAILTVGGTLILLAMVLTAICYLLSPLAHRLGRVKSLTVGLGGAKIEIDDDSAEHGAEVVSKEIQSSPAHQMQLQKRRARSKPAARES